jgi:flagellar basal body-associated protein FliL
MRKIVSDERARQASKGGPVLMVLIGSMVLLGIVMSAYLMWTGTDAPNNPSQNASREAVTGSPTASGNRSDRVLPQNPAYPAPTDATATGSTNRPANP